MKVYEAEVTCGCDCIHGVHTCSKIKGQHQWQTDHKKEMFTNTWLLSCHFGRNSSTDLSRVASIFSLSSAKLELPLNGVYTSFGGTRRHMHLFSFTQLHTPHSNIYSLGVPLLLRMRKKKAPCLFFIQVQVDVVSSRRNLQPNISQDSKSSNRFSVVRK